MAYRGFGVFSKPGEREEKEGLFSADASQMLDKLMACHGGMKKNGGAWKFSLDTFRGVR